MTPQQYEKLEEFLEADTKTVVKRIKRKLRWFFLQKDYCPICDNLTRWKFDGTNPIHPDGPPLFFELTCKSCGTEHIFLSDIMKHAIKVLNGGDV